MRKKDAVKLALRKSPRILETIKRLQIWDENKNLYQNAFALGAENIPVLRQFQTRYNLKFKKQKPNGGSKRTAKPEAYKLLNKSGWSSREIGVVFGVSHQAVQDSIKRIS